MTQKPLHLELYSRRGCHLCEDLRTLCERLRSEFRLQLTEVNVDADPARESSAPYLTMNPSEVLPVNLDVGNHRVVAVATRDTQFGPRNVGRYDRPLKVDVRGSGWELRFREGDFN